MLTNQQLFSNVLSVLLESLLEMCQQIEFCTIILTLCDCANVSSYVKFKNLFNQNINFHKYSLLKIVKRY